MPHRYRHHRYRNLSFFLLALIATALFSRTPLFSQLIFFLKDFGYLSAFFAGMLFTTTFGVAASGLILSNLIQDFPLIGVLFFGALGALVADILVFLFVRNQAHLHVTPAYKHYSHRSHFYKILHTHYFSWTLPVIGTLIMASPLPDELGVSLLGLSDIALSKFIVISFISHSIGIFSLVSLYNYLL
ncbi:hypothetical protein A3K55_00020 [Candidatus Shapirobacteria bacterium RBG_13_44_7]|uniref:TVP38/TMEM64 family membrane protein n=1 Tax=Candidatus Shapirobacteria bacterium RBG_13_44_7 TaxID=1802149 RepID=A0A1F7SEJ9_9BACT|nr:MAG: hypothetical protein A3K55_00020 [Candidatus Shapirobacteria bacterium RBG_13_44_7]